MPPHAKLCPDMLLSGPPTKVQQTIKSLPKMRPQLPFARQGQLTSNGLHVDTLRPR